jgi:indolepyruvate decarboxylase
MPTVADFVVDRLENLGLRHSFGLPGDYCLDLYDKLWNSSIKVINNTDENHSGFAADAYARVNGVGCVCVTYNVGALKVTNSIACAYAERSPVIILCGSPGMDERKEGMLLHHMVRSFECQHNIFENITCASTVLTDPTTAGYEIDRVLEVLKRKKQPVYIEIPRDIAKMPIEYDVYTQGTPDAPKSDLENLADAVEEVTRWINSSKNPVILAGVEIARFGLGKDLVKFAEKLNLPVITTLLSKSVISERHPLFAGIYAGPSSKEDTRKLVDESDCLLMFGDILTDMVLSFKPAKFQKRQVVSCSMEGLQVKNHTYTKVEFIDFCRSLFKADLVTRESFLKAKNIEKTIFKPEDKPVTVARFFEKIDSILDSKMAIVADVGDSLFGAGDLTVHHSNNFLSPAFYLSMGFAIPGALGAQVANPEIRPLVIVGDGAFQMTATELSTILEQKLNPIVFVLNNGGFTTERFLKEGAFNDIRNWEYHQYNKLLGGGLGFKVQNEIELESAIKSSLDSKELSVISIILDSRDISLALRRMTDALAKRV